MSRPARSRSLRSIFQPRVDDLEASRSKCGDNVQHAHTVHGRELRAFGQHHLRAADRSESQSRTRAMSRCLPWKCTPRSGTFVEEHSRREAARFFGGNRHAPVSDPRRSAAQPC